MWEYMNNSCYIPVPISYAEINLPEKSQQLFVFYVMSFAKFGQRAIVFICLFYFILVTTSSFFNTLESAVVSFFLTCDLYF